MLGALHRNTVVIHILLAGDAGEKHVEFHEGAFAGQEEVVAIVETEAAAQSIAKVGSLLVGQIARAATRDFRDAGGDVIDIHALDFVLDVGCDEIVHGIAQLERTTVIRLVVVRTEECCIAVEGLRTEGDPVAKEIRLGERYLRIGTLDTVLSADAQTLAATRETGPAENVEVRLLHFGETDEAVDRAEAGTEIERTGALFLDDDIEVLAAGNHGVGRDGLHLREIVEVFEALTADVDQGRIVDVAGEDGQLAADDAVFGPGVALDVDEVEVGLGAFVDAVGYIDQACTGG